MRFSSNENWPNWQNNFKRQSAALPNLIFFHQQSFKKVLLIMYSPGVCRNNTKNNTTAPLQNIDNELNTIFNDKPEFGNLTFHSIGGRSYQRNLILLEGTVPFNIMRKQWKQAEETILTETGTRNNNDVSEIRKQVVEVLSLCRYSILECDKGLQKAYNQSTLLKYLKLLKHSITPWYSLDERLLVKLTSTSVQDEQLPMCHYFHMYLDVQWLLLTLHYLCEAPMDTLNEFVKDLVSLSYTIYKKHNQNDIRQVNAFVCTCVKRLWILVQFFSEKLFKKGLLSQSFWEMFNQVLKEKDGAFSLWLLHHVAMLQGFTEDGEFVGPINIRVCENYSLIESKLKSLTSIPNDIDQVLLNCCKSIDPLLNQWWTQTVKSEPYQILWEVFYKHINVPFKTNSRKSAAELIELIGSISNNSNSTNSYEYFLYMLIKHLTKFPNQWLRIRGRIYSKLPPNKMNDLSDIGLYNITLLFLSLANSINMTEITEKLSSLLSVLKRERRNSPLVLNIYMSVVILHALKGFSIKDVCIPLLNFVQEAADNREMFHLIRFYIDGFDSVLNASQNFNLHQHVMIGNWISKYISFCQQNDLCYFLNVLSCNIKRIRNAGASSEWEHAFKQHVLLGLKQIATSSTAPSQVGELAALIDKNPSSDSVLIFTSDTISAKIVCQFITTLLEGVEENYVMLKNHETAVLHGWIRCCLLNCEDSAKLTENIMKISALSSVVDTRINFGTKPLCDFIKAMGKLIATGKTLPELCDQCFGRLDCWVIPHITAPSSEASAVHMYTCIALLFFHCAPLLYHKNKSSCLLNKLINAFLLSTDILMGKSPHPHVLGAIQRTWHLFVQGIYALDCSNDAYLERTLRDMIVRYVPLLPISDSPILKCLHNEKLMVLILDKISAAFLSYSARSTDESITKALKIVRVILESSASYKTTELVLHSTLTAIFEVIMFHSQKNMAADIVKYVRLSSQYEQLKQCVEISFIIVTEKHLAFNANKYFQFANTLAKIIPEDMRSCLSTIKKQVVEVERMRGVGYDNTLRQGLDRLEMLL